MSTHIRLILGLGALAAVTVANAQTRFWNWPGGGGNNAAGEIRQIVSSYNSVTNRLLWSANFGPISGSNLKTDGFHLVISPGDNPKGHAGEMAILYFDGSSASAPKLTVYNYNGFNGNSSYQDGSPANGIQAPDKIKSSLLSTDWINAIAVRDLADGSRTLEFDINATAIQNHTPQYPGNSPWTGVGYGNKIGIWFHSYAGTQASYGQDGYLTSLTKSKEGWLDLSDQHTSAVPEPATMAVLGLGAAAALRRRKKK